MECVEHNDYMYWFLNLKVQNHMEQPCGLGIKAYVQDKQYGELYGDNIIWSNYRQGKQYGEHFISLPLPSFAAPSSPLAV